MNHRDANPNPGRGGHSGRSPRPTPHRCDLPALALKLRAGFTGESISYLQGYLTEESLRGLSPVPPGLRGRPAPADPRCPGRLEPVGAAGWRRHRSAALAGERSGAGAKGEGAGQTPQLCGGTACPWEEKNTREKGMGRSPRGTVGDVSRAGERRGARFSPRHLGENPRALRGESLGDAAGERMEKGEQCKIVLLIVLNTLKRSTPCSNTSSGMAKSCPRLHGMLAAGNTLGARYRCPPKRRSRHLSL